jgi:hypothetical protein
MRHGRKSAAKRFDGHKMQVAADQQSELLLAVEPVAANSGDGRDLMTMIETVGEQLDVTVERAIGDGAYGTGDNRAACMERGIDLVSPLAVPAEPEVHKTAFGIDLDAKQVTCPQGHVATDPKTVKDAQGRPVLLFTFERKTCEACPLFERCVHSKTKGRSICTHYHEKLLQDARARQQTDEFKEIYVLRTAIEREIAGLVQHGLREARYVGKAKNRLQAQWTGAAINLRRLFALFKGDMGQMRQVLATVP